MTDELPAGAPADDAGGTSPGRTEPAAVVNTHAMRAAHRRIAQQEGDQNSGDRHSGDGRPADLRGDDRDRLLAVLLTDPVRAVGATVELQTRLRRLRSLTEAAQQERQAVGETLRRLAAAGLRPDQMTRVSGLPEDEVLDLLSLAGEDVRGVR